MNSLQLALRYGVFATVATVVNLATQHISLYFYEDHLALYLAIVFGTGTGLVTKYLLDKRWIFYDQVRGTKAQSRQFGLYVFMGIFTTALFWGSELGFALFFQSALMRDVGAVLGLAVGYYVKYRLDKRFVFNQWGEAA